MNIGATEKLRMVDQPRKRQMMAIRDACIAASVALPDEVASYFSESSIPPFLQECEEACIALMASCPLTVKDSKPITSIRDIVKLDIVNWNHLNGYWPNPQAAMDCIGQRWVGYATYTILETDDMSLAKSNAPWPNWKHVGCHEELARAYWHWFHALEMGDLTLSDSPDFWGHLSCGATFWGDFGQVSASAFAYTQMTMRAHDLWISVLSNIRQVLIEPFIDLGALRNAMIGEHLRK